MLRIILPDDLKFGDENAVLTNSKTGGIAESSYFELGGNKDGEKNEVKVLGGFLLKSSPN